jgi:hypothetical protein
MIALGLSARSSLGCSGGSPSFYAHSKATVRLAGVRAAL